jgi:hypothetical protein
VCLFSGVSFSRELICIVWLGLQTQVILVVSLNHGSLVLNDFSPLVSLAATIGYLYGVPSVRMYFRVLKQAGSKPAGNA